MSVIGQAIMGTLSGVDEGILVADRFGTIKFYNASHGVSDKMALEQVLGRHLQHVYRFSSGESLAVKCLRTGNPIVRKRIQYRTYLGTEVDCLNSLFPISHRGNVLGCISFLKDLPLLESALKGSDAGFHPPKKEGLVSFEDIIGASPSLMQAVDQARRAAAFDSSVLLFGETGTGKELFAQSIHHESPRREGPYVAINCASIPEHLFESMLFGTRKGAYTGAVDQMGLFEKAHGGTLFLDEIDSMPLSLQPKLLRAIQERRIRRVGALDEVAVDVRVISSTGTAPQTLMQDSKRFRRDLFYRLAVVLVLIPPLKERGLDVVLLTHHFIQSLNQKMGCGVAGVSPGVQELLTRYPWPGNVRELEHAIEGAMTLAGPSELLCESHLAPYFNGICAGEIALPVPTSAPAESGDGCEEISAALVASRGRVNEAAEALGISRQLLYYRMKKFGIDRNEIRKQVLKGEVQEALSRTSGDLREVARELGISPSLLHYRLKQMQ